jgi:hypothetical protein
MTKLFSLLIFALFFPYSIFSQTLSFKKVSKANKKTSSNTTPRQSEAAINQKIEFNTKQYNFLYDINSMGNDVKEKISFNKYNNLPLTEGIQKSYLLKILKLEDSSDFKNRIAVFKKLKGYLNAEFLNNEVVKIFLEPNISSTYVKEFLELNKVSAEFVNEQYIIYNKN